MAKRYTDVLILSYNSTATLQDEIAEFISDVQSKPKHYAEIQYSINNSTASALCMEYVEEF
jgi:hypothetical protein